MATKHGESDSKTSGKQGSHGGEQAANGTSHGKSGSSSSAAQKKGQSNSDKTPTSIIDLVVEDHVKVKDLFKQLQTLNDEDGEQIYQQLCWDVSLHAVAEELVMYSLQEKLGEEGKKMAQESRMDHEKTKGILRELDGKKLADHGVREMLGSALGALVEHINKEEENDLVYLREKLSEQELMDAGRDYQHCKSIVPDIAPSNQVKSEKQEDKSEEDSHFKTPMELLLSGKEKIQQILGIGGGSQGNNSSGGDKQGSKDQADGNKSSHGGQGGKSSGQQGSKDQAEGGSKSHGGQGGKSSGQQGSKDQNESDSKSHGGQGGKSGSSGQQGGKDGKNDKSSTGQEEHVYELRERDESGHVVHVDEHAQNDQAGQNDQGKSTGSQQDGRKSRSGEDDVEMNSQGNKKGGKEAGDKNGGDHGNSKNGQGKREHEEGDEHSSKKKTTDSRGGQDKMEVDSGSQ